MDIRLTGSDPQQLKDAADALSVLLSGIEGVVSTEDDMSWGREQLVYSLTPYGQALGLSIESVGTQLRAAYDGRLAQIYQDKRDEIEVRVQLPRAERESLASLSDLSIRLDDGRFVPLRQVITFTSNQGFSALRHADAQLATDVTADIDSSQTTAGVVLKAAELELPALASRYNVRYSCYTFPCWQAVA